MSLALNSLSSIGSATKNVTISSLYTKYPKSIVLKLPLIILHIPKHANLGEW